MTTLRDAIADALEDEQVAIAELIAPKVERYMAGDGQAVHPVRGLPDFEERMAAAKARAEWELGDASWAAVIIGAFADPASDASELAIAKRADT